MNLDKDYFLITTSLPRLEKAGLVLNEEHLINRITGERYYSSLLYDCGWGPKMGYVLDRQYSFDELITLALQKSKSEHNNFGAIEFIMCGTAKQENFRESFIKFVENTILRDDFTLITDYFQYFLYKNTYIDAANHIDLVPGGYYAEELLRKHPEWLTIESKVYEKLGILYCRWREENKTKIYDVRGRLERYP